MKITQTKLPLVESNKVKYRIRLKIDNSIIVECALFKKAYIENNKLVAEFECYTTCKLILWYNFEDYSFELTIED